MTSSPQRPKLRFWLVSLALFVGGFGSRRIITASDDAAFTYPYAIVIQMGAYGAAMFAWVVWWVHQAPSGWRAAPGCLGGILLVFASFYAIISTIPR